MNRITIIPEDGVVIVNGRMAQGLDLSFIDPTVHAVQWYKNKGTVEYTGPNYVNLGEAEITSLSDFQPALDAWRAFVDAKDLEAKRPYPSWVLNAAGDDWEAPVPSPNPNYVWDENTLSWQDPVDLLRAAAFLSRAQFKLALLAGGYLDDVETLMADPTTPREIRIMWEDSSTFERTHPALLQMAQAMGYTDAQMDAVFGIEA